MAAHLHEAAMVETRFADEASLQNDFAVRSPNMFATPVIFRPGRAKLSTKPEPSGSVAGAITMGIVWVARCAGIVRKYSSHRGNAVVASPSGQL
jgi:hypothetical protein